MLATAVIVAFIPSLVLLYKDYKKKQKEILNFNHKTATTK